MANPTTLPGDLVVPGNLRVSGSISPTMARSGILNMVDLQAFDIPLTRWRVWDALQTNLPGSAAADDLALVGGTFASASPTIQGLDFGGTTTTAYARAQIALPWEYVDGQTVTMRFYAGMLTAIADNSCTLDLAVYEANGSGGISADLCTTSAQSINSLVFANIDFTITPTALAPGDLLDMRIVVAGTDAGNLAVMIPCIGRTQLLCDVR